MFFLYTGQKLKDCIFVILAEASNHAGGGIMLYLNLDSCLRGNDRVFVSFEERKA